MMQLQVSVTSVAGTDSDKTTPTPHFGDWMIMDKHARCPSRPNYPDTIQGNTKRDTQNRFQASNKEIPKPTVVTNEFHVGSGDLVGPSARLVIRQFKARAIDGKVNMTMMQSLTGTFQQIFSLDIILTILPGEQLKPQRATTILRDPPDSGTIVRATSGGELLSLSKTQMCPSRMELDSPWPLNMFKR
ncbi:hypothetical protein K2173_015550 [Erythroxylum novogranatense]|uniref:Uncharacterized protein n=1 Tax=Erythroxylum novogranatense TaxID=1862640 RepID=A0AAV8SDX0_9ROSI|nr:hypothetical protein K2173_015550 [Erythroxylum novogranatense]